MTYTQVFKMISDIVGVPAPKIRCPYPLAVLLGHTGNIESFFTKKYPNLTPETARLTGNYLYYDSSKAISELGLPQSPVSESIARAVRFYQQAGII